MTNNKEETFEIKWQQVKSYFIKRHILNLDLEILKQLHDQRIKEIIKARHEVYCDMVIEKDAEIKGIRLEIINLKCNKKY